MYCQVQKCIMRETFPYLLHLQGSGKTYLFCARMLLHRWAIQEIPYILGSWESSKACIAAGCQPGEDYAHRHYWIHGADYVCVLHDGADHFLDASRERNGTRCSVRAGFHESGPRLVPVHCGIWCMSRDGGRSLGELLLSSPLVERLLLWKHQTHAHVVQTYLNHYNCQ